MALTISGLSKTYPNGVKALKNLSLSIGNSMFGLVGPNGAGKSSLMRTSPRCRIPTPGSINLDGIDVLRQKDEVRKHPRLPAAGVRRVSEDIGARHAASSGRDEGHDVFGRAQGDRRALLQQTNLWDVRKKALATFSGGMKQRFGIAQALLGNPRLIIVDEPTAGLDPAERNRFLNLLSSLGSDRTVILSTHIVDDVRATLPAHGHHCLG